jgi:hypothetical protein
MRRPLQNEGNRGSKLISLSHLAIWFQLVTVWATNPNSGLRLRYLPESTQPGDNESSDGSVRGAARCIADLGILTLFRMQEV